MKALINFAGGLRQDSCVSWEDSLIKGAAEYAEETRVPSLWFYGSNDSYFSTDTSNAMFKAYTAAGGNARMVAFGNFGNNSHLMFGSAAGEPIWQPEVTAFLSSVGMPSEIQTAAGKKDSTSVPVSLK